MINPWESIQSPNRDINVLRVSESHPLSMFWGRDVQGRYLFVYEVDNDIYQDVKRIPKLEGIKLFVTPEGYSPKLILILKDKSDWELFLSLCFDLIRATTNLPKGVIPIVVLIRRLTRWQSFLKRRSTNHLSKEEVLGLIGELLFLEEKVRRVFGWQQAIQFWKGPEGNSQDFLIHDSAIEVKCHSNGAKPLIRVSSAEQLDPQTSKGFLVVYSIISAESSDRESFSLNEVVLNIQTLLDLEMIETRDRFDDLLDIIGYAPLEEYDGERFKKVKLECFELRDGFPRLLLSQVADGIEKVSYCIKLEACMPFKNYPIWWENKYE